MFYQFAKPVTVQGIAHADGKVIDAADLPADSIDCLLRNGYIVTYSPPAPVPQAVTADEVPTPAAIPPPVMVVQPVKSIVVTLPSFKPETPNTKTGKRRKDK